MITTLPNNLSTLSGLKLLDVSHNRLSDISGVVCVLPNLVDLNLSYNRIITLAADTSTMSNLRRLSVRGNEISKLPDIFDCMNLTTLDICNNPLQEIPLSLGSLVSSMQDLYIDRNLHLSDPPDVMICRGTKLLLSYLNRQYISVPRRVSFSQKYVSFFLSPVSPPPGPSRPYALYVTIFIKLFVSYPS
jgi:Leucine-rich repeat (LRR) protein